LFFVQQSLAAFVAVANTTADKVDACLCALTIRHAKFDSHVVIDDMYRFVEGFGSPVLHLTGKFCDQAVCE
jgi:hypothetical protein